MFLKKYFDLFLKGKLQIWDRLQIHNWLNFLKWLNKEEFAYVLGVCKLG